VVARSPPYFRVAGKKRVNLLRQAPGARPTHSLVYRMVAPLRWLFHAEIPVAPG